MRGYAVSGIFGLIRKSILYITVSVALIALSLPVSFAKDSISPVTSPMPEPVPSIVPGSQYDTVTLFYVLQWNAAFAGSNSRYLLYEMICHIPHGSTAVFNIKRQQTALFFSGDRLPPFTRNIYDVLTGSLLESNTNANFSSYGTVDGLSSSYGFTAGYFPENNASSDICAGGFGIVPEGITITGGESVYNSVSFVTWSQKPLEHNIYHSQLSEPVADRYNRYFVVDDKLYWISIQFDGLYVQSDQIEGLTGYYNHQEIIVGSAAATDVNLGYSMYIPARYYETHHLDLPFYLCLVPSADQWSIGFKTNDLIVDEGLKSRLVFDLYLSEFDLSDGTYLNSSFYSFDSVAPLGYQYLLFESGSFSDIRCYGIDFYNSNNLPINLSDVIWEYDLEFVEWRDSMYLKLQQIYSLLSGNNQPAEEPGSYPDFAGSLNEAESGYSDVNPQDVKLALDGALGEGKYDHAAGQVKEWIDLFSIPKIIGVCILALALGTVTLTLGKKKSD